jgi:DNA polymerase III sliding clamp (beta) subunit (PCNA family)
VWVIHAPPASLAGRFPRSTAPTLAVSRPKRDASSIVRSLPDEDVHITIKENNSLLVESGTAKFRLLRVAAEDDRH